MSIYLVIGTILAVISFDSRCYCVFKCKTQQDYKENVVKKILVLLLLLLIASGTSAYAWVLPVGWGVPNLTKIDIWTDSANPMAMESPGLSNFLHATDSSTTDWITTSFWDDGNNVYAKAEGSPISDLLFNIHFSAIDAADSVGGHFYIRSWQDNSIYLTMKVKLIGFDDTGELAFDFQDAYGTRPPISSVPEPATILGFGIPMLMVGLGKFRGLRK